VRAQSPQALPEYCEVMHRTCDDLKALWKSQAAKRMTGHTAPLSREENAAERLRASGAARVAPTSCFDPAGQQTTRAGLL